MTPGTVSSTSPSRINGRSSSCFAVIAPWLAAWAIPTRSSAGFSTSARFVNVCFAVTVTSAFNAKCSTTSTRGVPLVPTTTSRRAGAKLINRHTSSYWPAGTRSKINPPLPSEMTSCGALELARSSIDAPGSGPPLSSRTEPAIRPDCARTLEAARDIKMKLVSTRLCVVPSLSARSINDALPVAEGNDSAPCHPRDNEPGIAVDGNV